MHVEGILNIQLGNRRKLTFVGILSQNKKDDNIGKSQFLSSPQHTGPILHETCPIAKLMDSKCKIVRGPAYKQSHGERLGEEGCDLCFADRGRIRDERVGSRALAINRS